MSTPTTSMTHANICITCRCLFGSIQCLINYPLTQQKYNENSPRDRQLLHSEHSLQVKLQEPLIAISREEWPPMTPKSTSFSYDAKFYHLSDGSLFQRDPSRPTWTWQQLRKGLNQTGPLLECQQCKPLNPPSTVNLLTRSSRSSSVRPQPVNQPPLVGLDHIRAFMASNPSPSDIQKAVNLLVPPTTGYD
jgi:hypothetical protein